MLLYNCFTQFLLTADIRVVMPASAQTGDRSIYYLLAGVFAGFFPDAEHDDIFTGSTPFAGQGMDAPGVSNRADESLRQAG